jgi:hypothetical protein
MEIAEIICKTATLIFAAESGIYEFFELEELDFVFAATLETADDARVDSEFSGFPAGDHRIQLRIFLRTLAVKP